MTVTTVQRTQQALDEIRAEQREQRAILDRMDEAVELIVMACRLRTPELLPDDMRSDAEEVRAS